MVLDLVNANMPQQYYFIINTLFRFLLKKNVIDVFFSKLLLFLDSLIIIFIYFYFLMCVYNFYELLLQ